MTREDWLAAFAAELGADAPSAEQQDAVLELAAEAAHASERTAAPIAAWMAGRAGRPLAEVLHLARRASGGAD